MILKDFKEVKYPTVGGLVHAIDKVMKSSVLKAQCSEKVKNDEQAIKKVLEAVNLAMGSKVNKILETEEESQSLKQRERMRLYENKIRLMTQQIDGLRKDLAIKVRMDQRKLRYAREQLSQFNDKIYGRKPSESSELRAVPIHDMPNFPSPYASQQNAASKNQLLNPLTLELSDQYELLPVFFQCLVPKTHLNLVQLIEFYDKFEIRREAPADGYEKAFYQVFRANFCKEDVKNCEVCY